MLRRFWQGLKGSAGSLCLLLVGSFSIGCEALVSQDAEREVEIGVMAPFSGDVASWGEMQRNSTELALQSVRSSPDYSDISISVTYEDDEATPKEGVAAFRKLISVDRVPFVVGSPASNVTLAVAPIANENKVVLLSSGSTATAVAEAGPYVFRIMPSDEVQASIVAEWIKDLGFTRIAVVYVNNAWGVGLKDKFVLEYRELGGEIAEVLSSEQSATDFRSQLTRIRAAGVEAIFAPVYTRSAGLLIRQAREMGLNQQFFGADVYGTPELIEAGGAAVEGVLYTTFGQYEGEQYKGFADRYLEAYGQEPETYATYCYDAFMIAVEAISRIPDEMPVTGAAIREELLGIKAFEGVTGLTVFDGRTNAIGKTFDKFIVKNGEFEKLAQ